jgi:hypothetical protein
MFEGPMHTHFLCPFIISIDAGWLFGHFFLWYVHVVAGVSASSRVTQPTVGIAHFSLVVRESKLSM